jgi:phosphotransferase system enzyme I (PtsI)
MDGDILIIDGYHGEVIVNPTKKELDYFREKIKKIKHYDTKLLKLKDEPAVTLDGREIKLTANLDLPEEIDLIVESGAKGIGLVRTEQLFEGLDKFPDEEEQYLVYKKLAEKVYPENVIVRVFDIGGDKVLPYDVKEPNPFLGWRGIRFLLDNLELFRTQVRAILRASTHKNVEIMIPMISSIFEIRESQRILNDCMNELSKEGISYDKEIKFGIMIEVPSAAVMAKEYSQEVDFISIGTNDLIMYLLAVDRGNDIVSDLYQEFHPSVIRILNHIIKEGKESKAMVTLCGEMAADRMATPLLVGFGLDSLSMSASSIPHIKKIIRSLNYEEVKKLAQECLSYPTKLEVNKRLAKFFDEKLIQETENIF